MNTLVVVPDGVGLRNFLLGSFLKEVSGEGRVSILHVVPEDLLPSYRTGAGADARWDEMIPYKENPVTFTLRYCLNYAQMYWADTCAMRYNLARPLKGSWRARAMRGTARSVGRASASARRIEQLDALHCAAVNRMPEVRHYMRLLRETKPSVLFCSHQRPPIILPAVLAAKTLGIPTATFIFSWDNLTSKGRIAAPFDHYLVWSEHMKAELLRYYPDVTSDRVHVVGTPQFDPYADDDLLWSREEFFRRVGADPTRPLISYTGGVASISPEDPEWVSILLEGIRDGHVRGNPQVLLRPAPVDERSRYDEVRRTYPELLHLHPEWVRSRYDSWRDMMPTGNDVRFLANLTRHADLNVNMASTMTLDFAIHDKPVVNIAFDAAEPPHFGTPLWDFFYQWEHYRPVVELGAARFARTPAELIEHVNAYLADPTLDREGRRRLVEMQVGQPIGESSRRIVEVLRSIAREPSV